MASTSKATTTTTTTGKTTEPAAPKPAFVIDGVDVFTERCPTGTKVTAQASMRRAFEVVVHDGDVYPEKAIENAAKAVAKKVKNWIADAGPAGAA